MDDFFKILASISTFVSLVLAYVFKVNNLEIKIKILELKNDLLEKITSNESQIKKIESDLIIKMQEMIIQWRYTEESLGEIKVSINSIFKKLDERK
ncbi:MAG: hypothetical protein SH817_10385 [Leptospira sp.]|nr:hypothetical protein [Leptospira sp.]